MYKISRVYYQGLNQTRARLTQQEPYRDFEVILDGDLSNLADVEIEDKAKQILSREFNTAQAIEDITKELDTIREVQTKVLNTFILAGNLTDEQKEIMVQGYDDYSDKDVEYLKGKVLNYNGELIEVIQKHRSQEDWIPLTAGTAALYKPFLSAVIKDDKGNVIEVVEDFKAVTGAHDVYKKGAKVRFTDGKIYVANRDNVVDSPAVRPEDWDVVND